MPRFSEKRKSLGTLPLSLQNLENFIAVEQKKAAISQYFQASVFLLSAAIIFVIAAIILVLNFYASPVHFSKRGWVNIRNLTPVVAVKTRVDGALEQVFVSQNQIVQKGELLGAVQTDPIKLDYKETQREFALKVVELHCFVSLQSNKSAFELPYNAQILVDKMGEQYDVTHRAKQCEREVQRNAIADQALEESIAAFDDQFRFLQNIVKQHGFGEESASPILENVYETSEGNPSSTHQNLIDKEADESGQNNPLIQFVQIHQELQKTRKEYLLRRLQKQEELDSAIQQATQELRYLEKRLRELNEQLDNNFIYATITGTVVGTNIAKPGTFFEKFESVFELQPIENEFQVSIPVEEEDVEKFITGTPAIVTLDSKTRNNAGQLIATTVAVLRKPNGKLEVVLDLDGDTKRNAKTILASGYRGEGIQRLSASITTGQEEIWKSVGDIVLGKAVMNSF